MGWEAWESSLDSLIFLRKDWNIQSQPTLLYLFQVFTLGEDGVCRVTTPVHESNGSSREGSHRLPRHPLGYSLLLTLSISGISIVFGLPRSHLSFCIFVLGFYLDFISSWHPFQDWSCRCFGSLPRNCLTMAAFPTPALWSGRTRQGGCKKCNQMYCRARSWICFWLRLKSWESLSHQDSIVNF